MDFSGFIFYDSDTNLGTDMDSGIWILVRIWMQGFD